MLKGLLRTLLFITLQQCIFVALHAQTKISSCLYLGEKEKYVLTEKIKLDNGEYQTFNSLFLWDKDKVVRIVFLYDRKLAGLSKANIIQLKSFEGFLPTFKKCSWFENSKYKHSRTVVSGINIYDGSFIDKREGEINGPDYAAKMKTVINARNNKYNPLADKFGSISISDGEPEVMIYNDKRRSKTINNLPLLFNSASGDSSYIISPLHIDVYRVDNSEKNGNNISKEFTGYKLYSTVSFLQHSVKYTTQEFIDEPYKWQNYFIAEHSLPYLYKTNWHADTGLLMNIVSEMPLSDKKAHNENGAYAITDHLTKSLSGMAPARIRADSIQKKETIKQQFLKDISFDYQYCTECYDPEISKKERINKHCPFKITIYKDQFSENWSYAFFDKYKYYFKVEKPIIITSGFQPSEDVLHEWLLMSPGIGYWMADVAVNNGKYSINSAYLFLNGKKIND